MINTLRITGVLAVLLAGVLFVFPVLFGVRSDESVGKFLDSPGVRERFEAAAGTKERKSEDRTSPLVQQAEAFALYLNPPKPSFAPTGKSDKSGLLPKMPTTSPKFKVFGTSYCQETPELSLALIDEPGRGRRWVRQSSTVGHQIIEQVKDGVVVVKSSEETYELRVEEAPATAATAPALPALPTPTSREALAIRGRTLPSPAVTTPAPATPFTRPFSVQSETPGKDAKLQELARQLIDVQKNAAVSSGVELTSEEKTARTLELITQYRAAQRSVRVSPTEAKELGDLGKELEQAQAEPNAALPAADEGKIEAGPAEPNSATDNTSDSK